MPCDKRGVQGEGGENMQRQSGICMCGGSRLESRSVSEYGCAETPGTGLRSLDRPDMAGA